MKKEQIIDVFFRKIQRIKRFLTSKDLFIFLFFLLISTSLWGLQALRKTYETDIQIPIKYENLPKDFVQTQKLPEKLKITISDRGNALVNYRVAKRFYPISINMADYVTERPEIATRTLKPFIQRQLNTGTQIVKITPDVLKFNFVQLKTKQLPVKLNQQIELLQQYTFCDTIRIEPKYVDVFAPENILDTMQFAYTDPLVLVDLKDTVQREVKLAEMQDVAYSSNSVIVTIKTEPYTEKTVEIPVSLLDVPSNRTLRIFPSVVNVSFQLGLSLYDKINASSFALTVNYNDILNNNQKKLPVQIDRQPVEVFNVKINPRSVDYLIEEKEPEGGRR